MTTRTRRRPSSRGRTSRDRPSRSRTSCVVEDRLMDGIRAHRIVTRGAICRRGRRCSGSRSPATMRESGCTRWQLGYRWVRQIGTRCSPRRPRRRDWTRCATPSRRSRRWSSSSSPTADRPTRDRAIVGLDEDAGCASRRPARAVAAHSDPSSPAPGSSRPPTRGPDSQSATSVAVSMYQQVGRRRGCRVRPGRVAHLLLHPADLLAPLLQATRGRSSRGRRPRRQSDCAVR